MSREYAILGHIHRCKAAGIVHSVLSMKGFLELSLFLHELAQGLIVDFISHHSLVLVVLSQTLMLDLLFEQVGGIPLVVFCGGTAD